MNTNGNVPANVPSNIGNNSSEFKLEPTGTSVYSSSEKISHQDGDLEALSGSSHMALGPERSSITTDSFPRVFKEFDFLEAEHDSISESTESCFNWLSTMRSPRCGNCHTEEHDDLGDEHEEEEFIQPDEYDEVDIEQNIRSSPQGANSLTSGTTPPSIALRRELFDSNGVLLRSRLASKHNGSVEENLSHKQIIEARNLRIIEHNRRGVLSKETSKIRRPLSSRASDSNDISSDRTPIQSAKHSEEEGDEVEENLIEEFEEDSCPSCPASDDEELITGKQRQRNFHLRRYRPNYNPIENSEKKESKLANKTPKRQNIQHLRNIKKPLLNVSQNSQQIKSSASSQSPNSMSFIGSACVRENLLGIVDIGCEDSLKESALMSFETSSIATSAAQQSKVENESIGNVCSIQLECNHHSSGKIDQLWNSLVLEIGNDQNGQMTSNAIMLFTQLLRVFFLKLNFNTFFRKVV